MSPDSKAKLAAIVARAVVEMVETLDAARRPAQYFTAAPEFPSATGFSRRQVEDAIRAARLRGVKVRRGYAVAADELARWADDRKAVVQRIVKVTRRRASNDDGSEALKAAGLVPGGR